MRTEDDTASSDVVALVRFLEVAVRMLGEAREEIDALNVYPVPDGDTGTNLYLTMTSALDAVRAVVGEPDEDGRPTSAAAPEAVWSATARGALLGARGNSGVILSQMLGAFAGHLARAAGTVRPGEAGAAVLVAEACGAAVRASYEAVGEPVEGTILTVARAAAEAARAAADDDADVRRTVAATAAAAREALRRTPEQLEVLARAGVVDAGGRGLVVVLDAAEHVVTGRRDLPAPAGLGGHRLPRAHGADGTHDAGGTGGTGVTGDGPAPTDDCEPSYAGPAYEVVYLLRTEPAGEHEVVGALRQRLAGLGDSLVVVGGEGLWKVHVHTDDAGAVVEAALAAGRPEQIRVTHLAHTPAGAPRDPAGRRVVAVAAGPGLERLFADAGARVVPGGPGRRPSTAMLLEAMTDPGADGAAPAEVVVLPNDADTVAAAELAAATLRERAGGAGGAGSGGGAGAVTVAVIPTRSQVQGLAALAVHEPARSLADDLLEMTATARHVRQGAVTVAARRAITMGGPCEPGDVLGVVAGDFVVVGRTLADVAAEVTERLLAGGGDLVTVVVGGPDAVGALGREAGEDPARVAAGLAAHLEERHATVDVVVYDGGQERYPLLLSVE